jgi:hypothetical protein
MNAYSEDLRIRGTEERRVVSRYLRKFHGRSLQYKVL